MKTLEIIRPEGLNLFTRRLKLTLRHMDLSTFPLHQLHIEKTLLEQQIVENINDRRRSLQLLALWCRVHLYQNHAVLMVDHDLSKSLEASVAQAEITDVVWPAAALEIRWRDESLPAIAAVNSCGEEPYFEITEPGGYGCGAKLKASEWSHEIKRDIAFSSTTPEHVKTTIGQKGFEALRYMRTLAMKVLCYASIPRCLPTELKTRNERKAAGIHPNSIYPTTRTLSLRSLPAVISPRPNPSEATGKSHRFFGRVGHLRCFSADRYKAAKGTWRWFPPIPPPEGIKVVYRVRSAPPQSTPITSP
jgi:hypothetical protein